MTDESSKMDKKNYATPPLKACIQDNSNKGPVAKQDGANWAANPRRRSELSFNKSSGQHRPESSVRKYSPQKSKGLEKKPRSRDNYPGESVSNKHHGPEVGSVQAPGAKKRDWDNLFYFAPRERAEHCIWKSHNIHRGRNDSGSYRSKFSKEHFLQANCKFLVKAGNDYEPYLADPDTLVDWNCIEQIVVSMIGEGASCPICLEHPVAGKMTRCGHLFCWSCILHYLALSDKQSRPCPICYESLCASDLKSVVTEVYFDVELGDVIQMQLLRRQKETLAICPMFQREEAKGSEGLYSKLLVISPQEVMEKVLDRELHELSAQLEGDPNCPEVCFVHQAIQNLNQRKNELMAADEGRQMSSETEPAIAKGQIQEKSGADVELNTLLRDQYYYFYQDCTGRNIFLHPMNFLMLVKQFGTELVHWPRKATLRIIDKEYYSANDETRKRWKFLRHLPMSSPFIIVEVDLRDYVCSDIITEFSDQMEYRQSRRDERVKEEKQMEKIIAERERKIWKIPVIPEFEPTSDFPDFLNLDGNNSSPTAEALSSSPSTDDQPHAVGSPFRDGISGSSSFAQIASRAPIKKSPSFPTGAWGKPVPATKLREEATRRHSDSEPDPEFEDYVTVPEFRTSMSHAITKALENLVFDEAGTGDSNNAQRKKKKKKGKVLFATGGTGSFN